MHLFPYADGSQPCTSSAATASESLITTGKSASGSCYMLIAGWIATSAIGLDSGLILMTPSDSVLLLHQTTDLGNNLGPPSGVRGLNSTKIPCAAPRAR